MGVRINLEVSKLFYLIILISILSTNLFGQSITINGYLLDSENNRPVAFANVFLAQTTIGTSTNESGYFIMEVPSGEYQLVTSHIGFELNIQDITFKQDTSLHLILQQKIKTLKELVVSPDTTNWFSNYKLFVGSFIGETRNAEFTKIQNPKDIYFYYDDYQNKLYGFSNKEIVIINEALGYKIFYTLREFEMNFKSGFLISYGIPRFQTLNPPSKKQLRTWQKNRRKAYNGSFYHFLSSLKQNKIKENGFQVREIFRTKVDKDTTLVRGKIQYFRKKLMESSKTNDGFVLSANNPIIDSLSYWNKIKNEPNYIDSLGSIIINRSTLMPESNIICCKSILQISYLNEREEFGYRGNGKRDKKQTSLVHFQKNPFRIDSNGFYAVEKVIFENYLAWSSKLAEMLPLDYINRLNNPNRVNGSAQN